MKFRHIGIVCAREDFPRLISFYSKIGFEIPKTIKEDSQSVRTAIGMDKAVVHTTKLKYEDFVVEILVFDKGNETESKQLNETGYTHFAVTVTNITELYYRLKHDYEYIHEPVASEDGKVLLFFCKDPCGNYIEFVEEL